MLRCRLGFIPASANADPQTKDRLSYSDAPVLPKKAARGGHAGATKRTPLRTFWCRWSGAVHVDLGFQGLPSTSHES